MKLKNIIATLLCLSLVSFALCSTASAALNLKELYKKTTDFFNNNDNARGNVLSPDKSRVYTYGNALGDKQYCAIIGEDSQSGVEELRIIYGGPTGSTYNTLAAIDVTTDGIYSTGAYIKSGEGLNIFITKHDLNGNKVWEKSYNGPANSTDVGVSIVIGPDDHIYCTGYTYNPPNNYDIITIKYDRNGNEIWRKFYDNGNRDMATNIFSDPSRNVIYVCGNSIGTATPATDDDIVTICYDYLNGNQRWVNRVDNSGARDRTYGSDFKNNSILVTGVTYPYPYTVGKGLTAKISAATGGTDWIRTITGLGETFPQDVAIDENGNSCVVGYSRIDWSNPNQAIAIGYDAYGDERFVVTPFTPASNSSGFNAATVMFPPQPNPPGAYCVGTCSNVTSGNDGAIAVLNLVNGEILAIEKIEGSINNFYGVTADEDGNTYYAGVNVIPYSPTKYDFLTVGKTEKGGGQAHTPKGTNVTVSPDPAVTITFDSVIEEGITYATPVISSLPSSVLMHVATWDLNTTAVTEGNVTLIITYPEDVDPDKEKYLSLLKLIALETLQGSEPIGSSVNEVFNTITASRDSLSTYEVAYITEAAPALEYLIARVQSMNLKAGIENSLDVKLQSAVDALEEARKNALLSAINKIQAFINECEAQKGKALTEEQADELAGWGLFIIKRLQ